LTGGISLDQIKESSRFFEKKRRKKLLLLWSREFQTLVVQVKKVFLPRRRLGAFGS
jgi:hypothetical protein